MRQRGDESHEEMVATPGGLELIPDTGRNGTLLQKGEREVAETAEQGRKTESELLDTRLGNEYARLVSTRVVNIEGKTITNITVDEPVGIEIVYDVLKGGKNIQPALHFDGSNGTQAFVIAYTDPDRMLQISSPGRYWVRTWIPPNLLNEGAMYVTVCVCTPDPMERHCQVDRALSFHVYEKAGAVDTARGAYSRSFPGVIRPKLDWETQFFLPKPIFRSMIAPSAAEHFLLYREGVVI